MISLHPWLLSGTNPGENRRTSSSRPYPSQPGRLGSWKGPNSLLCQRKLIDPTRSVLLSHMPSRYNQRCNNSDRGGIHFNWYIEVSLKQKEAIHKKGQRKSSHYLTIHLSKWDWIISGSMSFTSMTWSSAFTLSKTRLQSSIRCSKLAGFWKSWYFVDTSRSFLCLYEKSKTSF